MWSCWWPRGWLLAACRHRCFLRSRAYVAGAGPLPAPLQSLQRSRAKLARSVTAAGRVQGRRRGQTARVHRAGAVRLLHPFRCCSALELACAIPSSPSRAEHFPSPSTNCLVQSLGGCRGPQRTLLGSELPSSDRSPPEALQRVCGDQARSPGVTRVTLVLCQRRGLGVFSSSQQKAKVRARRLSWLGWWGRELPALEQTVPCPGSPGFAEPGGLKPGIAWCNAFPRHERDKRDLC